MEPFNLKSKISLIFLLSIFYFLFSIVFANAQTSPQFMVSWQAQSYVPSWYSGKIFPAKGSRVEVNFELIDSGKIADLSKYKVRWYVNDKLKINENSGLGIKSFVFTAANYPGQDIEVRIAIVNYKGAGELNKIIRIPVASPEAVIDAPYAGKKINYGSNDFTIHPFFFNNFDFSRFSFNWSVDGRAAENNGATSNDKLKLNIDSLAPSGYEINISATIKNLLDEMEFASKNIQLQVK